MKVHAFDSEIAQRIGVNAAIVLRQIEHYMRVAKDKNYKKTHYKDGKWWAKTSTRRLHEHMPYLSKNTINWAIKILEDLGILISCKFKRYKYDQTKFYTIDYNKIDEIISSKTTQKQKKIYRFYHVE